MDGRGLAGDGARMAFARLPVLFLLCALPLGLVLARLVPPGEVPDEAAHAIRAYAVSTGQWIGRRAPAGPGGTLLTAGYTVDTGLFAVALAPPDGLVTADLARQRDATGWSGAAVFASVPNTASYAPALYLVSGAALGAGRWLGLGPAFCLQAARVANLLAYAALGALALRLARRARFLLFALLCLPGSVSLAASLNQDGLLIALAVLAASLLTRPGATARRWAALPLAAVCLAKPPYLPLAGLLIIPPGRWRWAAFGSGAGLAVAAALPALAWTAAAVRRTLVPFTTGTYTPGPLYAGAQTVFDTTDSGAQLAILLADPLRIITLPVEPGALWWRVWPHEVIGVLGQLSLVLPDGLYAAWFAALACALAGDVVAARRDAAPWGIGRALIVLGTVGASVLLVFVAQYLSWPHVGADSIAGVQGRYFVPLLAALVLAVPSVPALRGAASGALAAPAALVSAGQFVAIPLIVVRRWYLH